MIGGEGCAGAAAGCSDGVEVPTVVGWNVLGDLPPPPPDGPGTMVFVFVVVVVWVVVVEVSVLPGPVGAPDWFEDDPGWADEVPGAGPGAGGAVLIVNAIAVSAVMTTMVARRIARIAW